MRFSDDRNLRAHSSRSLIVPVAVPASSDTELVRRFIEELWNGRKLELADQLISSDCQTHQLRSGAPLTAVRRGPDAIKHHVAEWLRGFPDLRFTIEQMFSSGNKVFTQSIMEGAHTGSWLEIPATNKRVTVRMMTVHRIACGKIAEDWVLVESLGFFQQLGLIAPTPELFARAKAGAERH